MAIKKENETPKDMIFSLDIGTRNVVGTLASKDEDAYRILDYEIIPHPDRAMYDGQIHDIDKVAKVVSRVKEKLEFRSGFELKNVAIAAAGRALKTRRVTTERTLDHTQTIDKELIDNVEMEAIQIAQAQLEEHDGDVETSYYCVGYSVVHYYLDQSMIINPKGHRGSHLKVDLIATFLPHIVVDSLYTVVDQVGLEVVNLTLEPIAAINVAIPEKFRLLNLALVDVGAGTSDIAITKDGSIISYAMVSVAGDEITEALSKAFLLDFDTAEKLKVGLNIKDKHTFSDIVGMSHEFETHEILERIDPVIKNVTQQIAERILEFNESAPSAIFCIGGGCQIPGFTQHLSSAVDLPSERTVIKGTEMLENTYFEGEKLIGPEYITPIGIGYTALQDQEQDFLQVTVNEKQIRLFNSKALSVSDALVLIGYSARKLIAERGESINYTLNGQKRTVLGDYGEAATIYVNGRLSSLDTKIKNKDSIIIDPAIPGKAAGALVKEVLNQNNVVYYRGEPITLLTGSTVNGERVESDYALKNGDTVVTEEIKTVSDFIEWFEISIDGFDLLINGESARRSQSLKNGDTVEVKRIRMEEVVEETEELESIQTNYTNVSNQQQVLAVSNHMYKFVVNQKDVLVSSPKSELIFVDIFDYIDFDLSVAKGILQLKLNGKRANYTDALRNGDVIHISWK